LGDLESLGFIKLKVKKKIEFSTRNTDPTLVFRASAAYGMLIRGIKMTAEQNAIVFYQN
jgi:hypothetical protein